MGKSIGADGICVYEGTWWKLALPRVTLPVHLALVAAASAWAARRTAHPAWDLVLGFAGGLVLWSLFEYAFHRWLLHHTRIPLLRRIFWDALHKEHHGYRRMHDPDHHAVHLVISAPVIAAVLGTCAALSAGALPLDTAAGWALGYCVYEALHWFFHSREEVVGMAAVAPLRGLWAAHRVHHLVHAGRNYGFTTGLWDRALGTKLRG